MRGLETEPVLKGLLPFIAGILAARYFAFESNWPFLLLLIMFLVSIAAYWRRSRLANIAIVCSLLIFGVIRYTITEIYPANHISRFYPMEEIVDVEGVIIS